VDATLVTVARSDAGRDDRVVALFEGHHEGLCRLAYMLLGDAGAAEDVVQEAFLRTFSGWRRLRDPGSAGFYLRRTVVNLCWSRLRRKGIEQRSNEAVHRAADTVALPDGDRVATVLAVLAAVRALPARQRMAVVLRYYADDSESNIAEAMSCSVGTVKSQLAKARATLTVTLADNDRPDRTRSTR
jgi:RNA polymerase sigma-70 factor (sigma-E family)